MKKDLICKIWLYIAIWLIIIINGSNLYGMLSFFGKSYQLITDSYPKAGESIFIYGPDTNIILTEDMKPSIDSIEVMATISIGLCIIAVVFISKDVSIFKKGIFITIVLCITIFLSKETFIPNLINVLELFEMVLYSVRLWL